MPDIRMRLGRDLLVIDGAFGTMLHKHEFIAGQCPEQLNVIAEDIVAGIHHDFVITGADCVTTNSFGGTRVKLAEYGLGDQVEELNRAAVQIAKSSGAQHVLADVGPTGLVMQPLGEADFEYVFELFAEQISALFSAGPDAILIETMTDIAEARCAVLAARSVCDLPVFVTCTFGVSGRMELSGTDPATAAVILEAAGAEAVGINCGLGPEQTLPLVRQMAAATRLPLIVQPNAGIPRVVEGVTVFPGTPDEMGEYSARFVEAGASLVGSCCGSTPAFTGAISDFARSVQMPGARLGLKGTALAGPRGVSVLGEGHPVRLIGERINPTGKPELAAALKSGSMSLVRQFAEEQAAAGADLLDVNVGVAGIDEEKALREAVLALSACSDLPLVLDTTNAKALEAALRVYPGRALVNSVNGGAESMATVLPLAETYGAAVVVLALDDSGIPDTVEGRVAVIERVREEAYRAGLTDADLVVDTLVMTAAIDKDAPRITVGALAAVKAMGLSTVLGVSNVSHGLPSRPALNAAFAGVAAAAGMDCAIVNPSDPVVTETLRLANIARGAGVDIESHGRAWDAWDAAYEQALAIAAAGGEGGSEAASEGVSAGHDGGKTLSPEQRLVAAVRRGDAQQAPSLVDAVIDGGVAPHEVIFSLLAPAIQRLGDAFGRGEVFLPQLLVAADAMKAAVTRVKEHLPEGEFSSEGKVVFATVKGDIHSIGKDICISLLESQGFQVVDLGVDVEPESVLEALVESQADVVCLSALMTTTLSAMERTVALVVERAAAVPVLVGGAVVTGEWARSIGAGYSADAPGCVSEVRRVLASRKESGAR